MADTRAVVDARLRTAFDTIEEGVDPVLRPSDRADFQANGALGLAKRLGRNPRELAEEVIARAELADICSVVEVSGPGFINLTLADGFLSAQVAVMAGDERLGIEAAPDPSKIVIDYSAPNVAKEMHVGHLRGTVIGDALTRTLAFAGHEVIRENHVGDWGTPFGMLIEHLVDLGEETAVAELSVGDLDAFYRDARTAYAASPTLQERSRNRVVLLQGGDEDTLRLWRVLVAESVAYFNEVYGKLGVLLEDSDVVGESSYNPMLDAVVEDLGERGLLVENDGALCVFPPAFPNREGEPLPLIVRKSDGGYGYAATDLAAVRDRVGRLGARRILYVVGAPQAQHFEMVFAVARMAGWLPDDVEAVHVSFANVLGPDHKMLKTRSGSTIKLVELLDEAVERAETAMAERQVDLDPSERAHVARLLGIGAVKYADLSTDRTRDYVFDWERMLAFDGNTAPYLQYAHARIRSIFRRSEIDHVDPATVPVVTDPFERALTVALLGFAPALGAMLETYSPSKLCAYLYDLATTFTSFYENTPVLRAPDEATRNSRLLLAELTARVLALGLSLLGIGVPDRM